MMPSEIAAVWTGKPPTADEWVISPNPIMMYSHGNQEDQTMIPALQVPSREQSRW
jgi:hypothetical protein